MAENDWIETGVCVLTILLSGAFGGVINAIVTVPPDAETRKDFYSKRYLLPCPLRPGHDKPLGWIGHFLIGSAAGISVFVGIEGIFAIKC